MFDYEVLGPLRVNAPGGRVAVARGHSSALLCWLLATVNHHSSPDEVIDVVWPGDPPHDPRRAVQGLVRRLAALVEPGALVSEPAGYILRVGEERIDARRFEQALRRGLGLVAAGDTIAAEEALHQGLAWWRGDPYPELTHHPMILAEITGLFLLRLTAIEELNGILLTRPVDYALVASLEAMTARHPERERLWRQLALALYRTGRQAEALRTFGRCRRAFGDGAEVLSDAGTRLERAIARQDPALSAGELPGR